MRYILLIGLVSAALSLPGCERETTTAPPTGAPTAPPPPVTPPAEEPPPPDEPPDPDGRAVPETDPASPIIEGEGPGAPGTRPGPTVR